MKTISFYLQSCHGGLGGCGPHRHPTPAPAPHGPSSSNTATQESRSGPCQYGRRSGHGSPIEVDTGYMKEDNWYTISQWQAATASEDADYEGPRHQQ